MESLFKGLQVLMKYMTEDNQAEFEVSAYHDTLLVYAPYGISEEDRYALLALSHWYESEEFDCLESWT